MHEQEANANALRMLGGAGSFTVPKLPTHTSEPSRTESLASEVREPVEAMTGFDLRSVRVHTGRGAAEQTRREGAHAFTRGRDVYFGPGRYRPDHPLGRALIAHELTHVAQQRAVPQNPVVAHLRGLAAGERNGPELYRQSIDQHRARMDSLALERGAALMSEREAPHSPSPAPQGMTQRTISCNNCNGGNSSGQSAPQQAPPANQPAPPANQPAPPANQPPAPVVAMGLTAAQLRAYDASRRQWLTDVHTWLNAQVTLYQQRMQARRQHYQDKNWAWPAGGDQKYRDYQARVTELQAIRASMETSLRGGQAQNDSLLILANVVANEANTSNAAAKQAVAYAYLNRTGGNVRVPRAAEISNYQDLPTRWAGFNDVQKLAFLRGFTASLGAALGRLQDATPAQNDPTGGATHWVSPVGLSAYNPNNPAHQADRYSRTVGNAQNRAFPTWARATNDPAVAQMQQAGQLGQNFAEVIVRGVAAEQFLFYRDVN